MAKVLYFDVETTGLDPKKHAIIQLAGIIEVGGVVVDEFNIYMQPHEGAEIDKKALEVNGVTREQMATYQVQEEAFKEFGKVLSRHSNQYDKNDKYYPAGYNVQFDLDFLSEWFKRNNDKYLGSRINWRHMDPRPYYNALNFLGLLAIKNVKLATVCKHYDIEINAHDAMSDIRATRELILRMLDEIK